MPSSSGSAVGRLLALGHRRCSFSSSKLPLLDLLVDQEVGVADLLDPHAAQHLPDDHLDVLVVDLTPWSR